MGSAKSIVIILSLIPISSDLSRHASVSKLIGKGNVAAAHKILGSQLEPATLQADSFSEMNEWMK